MSTFLKRFLPGESPSMTQLRNDIERLNRRANVPLVRTVLVTGESGAGKTHVARVLAAHREFLSAEVDAFEENPNLASYLGDFDEINVPNLPNELVESELFGHVKGAFTGATHDKLGLLSADAPDAKSDILLDEIGDATPQLQAKLLQVVETGRFRRIGAAPGDDEETGARLLFATNRSLEADAAHGHFREDLLWRLSVFRIHVPPLREQRDQIRPILVRLQSELASIRAATGELENSPELTHEDLAWATQYDWPGNVRQLRAAVQRWLVYDGARRLSEVAAPLVPPRSNIAESRVASVLEGDSPIGNLKDLLALADRDAKRTILAWYSSARPTAVELGRRFPSMSPRSFQQKMSDWRRELGDV